jgi:hypothetical protein
LCIFINKRGLMKSGFNSSTTGEYAQWVAEYASVSFSCFGYMHAWAGMNERGLTLSTMGLPATFNQPPDHRPPLDWMWVQCLGRSIRPGGEAATDRAHREFPVHLDRAIFAGFSPLRPNRCGR